MQQAGETTKVPEGPEGAVSYQTRKDISMLAANTRAIVDLITGYQAHPKVNLQSITTLFVENFFAQMRAINDMPTVLEFAHKFSKCCREMIKRTTGCSFVYHTSAKHYYPQAPNVLPFNSFPSMPVPKSRFITPEQAQEMRIWKIENGQGVRQLTVRNMSTKDKPGTLPLNAYVKKSTPCTPFSFQVGENHANK